MFLSFYGNHLCVQPMSTRASAGHSLAIASRWVNGNFAQLADVFTPLAFSCLNDNDYHLVLSLID
ncbi:hypothetical protein AZF00_13555 [Zhongshania aliphaticivorans]|uniref:Uncharacterized protein n=1 Tax=Zhongshania aliphaticivorans TaxID=1470434 RepID=A0A127M7Q6_9GAMM|nr:hypothetical protein AZF00_13555 [Zhongshania aliphaticivorans]